MEYMEASICKNAERDIIFCPVFSTVANIAPCSPTDIGEKDSLRYKELGKDASVLFLFLFFR